MMKTLRTALALIFIFSVHVKCENLTHYRSINPKRSDAWINKCEEKCGDSNDIVCVGEPFGDIEVNCICKDSTKEFIDKEKECKVNRCSVVCGISEDVVCKGDPFGDIEVNCICIDANKKFVEEDKMCKVDRCEVKCGISEDVECNGDPFGDTEVICACKDVNKKFVDKELGCKGSECTDMCGTSVDVTCDLNSEKPCACKTGKGIFIDNVVGCRNYECIYKCGASPDITCDLNSEMPCTCKTGKGTFIDKTEGCRSSECTDICGTSADIKCDLKSEMPCICRTGKGIFIDRIEGCRNSECTDKCGISEDVACDLNSKMPCICKTGKGAFIDKIEGCRSFECTDKCGTSTDVTCDFNSEMPCICKTGKGTFIDNVEGCRSPKCVDECGMGEDVTCGSDPEKPDCGCLYNGFTFLTNLKECRKTCNDDYCKNGAKCTADSRHNRFCECREGSSGEFCEIVDECIHPKFKYCKGYNGTCILGKESDEALCECHSDKKFDDNLGVCRETCKEDDCKNGAKCIADVRGNTFCKCREGSSGDFCESLYACRHSKFKYCKEDNGTCVLDEKSHEAFCDCHGDKKFDDNLDACREVCNDDECKNGAHCTADVKGNKFCKCRKGSFGDFCEIVDECRRSKFKNCKGYNGTCVLSDKTSTAVCKCKGDKEFDENLNECRENKCKILCGEKEDVRCDEDPYGEFLICGCEDKSKEFDPRDKSCKVSVNECKEKCGIAYGVLCVGGGYGSDVYCYCKDNSKIFIQDRKICLSLCEMNPCFNGAECIKLGNRGFTCKCKDSYKGAFCNETSQIIDKPSHQVYMNVTIIGAMLPILLVVLIVTMCVRCKRR